MLKSRKIFICIAVVGIVVPLVFLSQTSRHSSSHRRGSGVVRAGDALNEIKERLGVKLKHPKKLLATNFRKHTATIAQVLNLEDNELKWLCNHLGHTMRIHEQYYRQTSGLIERIDIAKLMIMKEHNLVGKFSGRKLSEIQFDGPKTKVVARFRENVVENKTSMTTLQNTNIPADVIQRERLATLQQGCHQLDSKGMVPNSVTASQLGHILVDDTYQVMFCYIPKVACTNMKRVFLLLTGKMNTTNPIDIQSRDVHYTYDKYLKYLSDYSSEVEINYRIKSYKKIIFVREPLERLLSAYRNKFMEKSEYFHQRFGRRIIKRYRQNPSVSSVELGNDVQFIEFIRYITDSSTLRREGYNEHWAHYSGLCHPCLIRYDYIGKYETIDEDIDQILRDLHMDQIIKFPARGAIYKGKKTKDTMTDFYGKIPPPHLRLLWKIYVNDYKLFGYPYPEVLRQFLSDPGQT